jgi:hypothetical protein
MTPTWISSWAWGLPLIALTLMIHVAAIVVLAIVLIRVGPYLENRKGGRLSTTLLTITIIGLVGLALAILHGLEAAIWAVAYLLLGALATSAEAMLYSMDSFTTRGESGFQLQSHWRLMGALEAADGVLLFGISTAFIFAVIDNAWGTLRRLIDAPSGNDAPTNFP